MSAGGNRGVNSRRLKKSNAADRVTYWRFGLSLRMTWRTRFFLVPLRSPASYDTDVRTRMGSSFLKNGGEKKRCPEVLIPMRDKGGSVLQDHVARKHSTHKRPRACGGR